MKTKKIWIREIHRDDVHTDHASITDVDDKPAIEVKMEERKEVCLLMATILDTV